MPESICKSCMESVHTKRHISNEQINEAIDKLSVNKRIKLASDRVYEFRLMQCRGCEHLEYGTTCLKCGCFVQIRAKLADSVCPLSKQNRWNNTKYIK